MKRKVKPIIVEPPTQIRDRILHDLRDRRRRTTPEIAEVLGLSEAAARRYMHDLWKLGLVKLTVRGSSTAWQEADGDRR